MLTLWWLRWRDWESGRGHGVLAMNSRVGHCQMLDSGIVWKAGELLQQSLNLMKQCAPSKTLEA
jgi:hypothetical protein